MDTIKYSQRIDSLYRQSRNLIERNPQDFTIAGTHLAEIISEQFARNPNALENSLLEDEKFREKIEADTPCLNQTSEQILIRRLFYARQEAVYEYKRFTPSPFDFDPTHKMKDRKLAARMTMLVILLSADPDANEYISPEITELARLPHESYESKGGLHVLGRDMICWHWREEDMPLCGSANPIDVPTPRSMNILESAFELLTKNIQQEQQPTESKPVVNLNGWVKNELVQHVKQHLGSFSPSTFDRIRREAGVKPSKSGGVGQQRRYSQSELKQMIRAVKAGSYRNRHEIAKAWQSLCDE